MRAIPSERLRELPPELARKLEAALALTASLPPDLEPTDYVREEKAYAEVLRSAGFSENEGGLRATREIPLAEDLTAEQRVVAEILAHVEGVVVHRFGLYATAWARRRWLGIDPPGALFREIDVEIDGTPRRWPFFHVLRVVALASEKIAIDLVEALPIGERIEVLAELTLAEEDYGHRHVAVLIEKAIPEIDDTARDWAVRFADRLKALSVADRTRAHAARSELARATFVALVRGGVPIEPGFEWLLSLRLRSVDPIELECIRAIPETRRESAIIGALRRVPFESDSVDLASALLEHFPFPGIAVHALENLRSARKPRDVIAAVKDAAARSAEVAEAVAGHPDAGEELEPVTTVYTRPPAEPTTETPRPKRAPRKRAPAKKKAAPEKKAAEKKTAAEKAAVKKAPKKKTPRAERGQKRS